MEEKILIKSEKYKVKKLSIGFIVVGFALSLLYLGIGFLDRGEQVFSDYWLFDLSYFYIYLIPVTSLSLIGVLMYLWLNCYNLTVSDKRVSGEVLFGKKVDLPVDSISAVSVISIFKGVGISTSSGRIGFFAIKNSSEIYDVINNLLIKRQEDKNQTNIVSVKDETEQLKKYKDLLDSGVITQEEFDQKKKQLLDL